MTQDTSQQSKALAQLRVPLMLTWAGMTAERAAIALWPLWSLIISVLAFLMLGWHESLPVEVVWIAALFASLAMLAFLILGFVRFRLPSRFDALACLDASLKGRPIQALMDSQAIGPQDDASKAVWQAHQARMAEKAKAAKHVKPTIQLASRDPYALRYVAVLALAIAVLFGSLSRVASVSKLSGGAAALASGPVWEGWVEPPAYTGKPSLYLNDLQSGFAVPESSRISIRLYGEIGALTVSETVSERVEVTGSAADPEQTFFVQTSGTLDIAGPNGRSWDIEVTPDAAPSVEVIAAAERTADGMMSLPFAASDDYGVESGTALIELDLAAVPRRYGFAAAPEKRDPIELDLPMPISGERHDFDETLIGDFSQHPFANLPVKLSMSVEDAVGQRSGVNVTHMILPGRRFFDPLAGALIEQRQWLLWSKVNASTVAQILRAISHRPDDIFRSETAYLRLRVILRRLETQLTYAAFNDDARDEAAQALWDLALLIEEGDVEDALERMRRAQERLSEAMKNGASDDEIAQLMEELRRANENYIQQLQRETARNGENSDRPQGSQDEAMQMTQQDLQEMMDRIQELMEEGRMAEAEQALQELQEMMENMQIAEGQQGSGQPSQGEQAMEDLSDTLRQQQGLSDQAFRDLQEQYNPGAQAGESGQNEGRNGGQGRGQSHENGEGSGQSEGQAQGDGRSGQGQETEEGLAQRQSDLAQELERQRGGLPGAGTEAGEAARDALRQAEEAMRGAGDALERNDLPEAIDRQAEAMDALRNGIQNLGEALAQNERREGQQGTAEGRPSGSQSDPLGRNPGASGQAGTDEGLLQGEDVYRRARELLDEIRKRSGESARPEDERNYLRRLLDRF